MGPTRFLCATGRSHTGWGHTRSYSVTARTTNSRRVGGDPFHEGASNLYLTGPAADGLCFPCRWGNAYRCLTTKPIAILEHASVCPESDDKSLLCFVSLVGSTRRRRCCDRHRRPSHSAAGEVEYVRGGGTTTMSWSRSPRSRRMHVLITAMSAD